MASFSVEVDRGVRKETRRLPGNVRQRVIRALKALRSQPRPPNSEPLDVRKWMPSSHRASSLGGSGSRTGASSMRSRRKSFECRCWPSESDRPIVTTT